MMMSMNSIALWIRAIINNAYKAVSDEDGWEVKIKAQEVFSVGPSLLLRRTLQSVKYCIVHFIKWTELVSLWALFSIGLVMAQQTT